MWVRRPSLQEFQDLLRGARDHRLLPPDDDRALHELGVLEEQRDHRFGRLVGVCIQLQGLEVLVLSDELRRGAREQFEKALDIGSRKGVFEVVDDVELDVALAQDVQRAA